MIGQRRYFVSQARYAYRGLVTDVRGSIAVLKDNSQIIDLGSGVGPPTEEIQFPDGMEVDLAMCEMNVPEPTSWTRK